MMRRPLRVLSLPLLRCSDAIAALLLDDTGLLVVGFIRNKNAKHS